MLRTLANWWRRARVPVQDPAQLSLTLAAAPVAVGPAPRRPRLRAPPEAPAAPPAAPPGPPAVRSPRTRAEADGPLVARLAALHTEFNARCFGCALTTVEIVVSGRMRSRLGHYQLRRKNRPGLIAISRRHIRRHGWAGAKETLLHEMVHQWQDEEGLPVDHGAGFRRMAKAVGITPRATRRV